MVPDCSAAGFSTSPGRPAPPYVVGPDMFPQEGFMSVFGGIIRLSCLEDAVQLTGPLFLAEGSPVAPSLCVWHCSSITAVVRDWDFSGHVVCFAPNAGLHAMCWQHKQSSRPCCRRGLVECGWQLNSEALGKSQLCLKMHGEVRPE